MKRKLLPVLLAGLSLCFSASAGGGNFYLGLGGGIQHSSDWALQLAAPVQDAFEVHYSRWNDGRHVGALGLSYRWHLSDAFSLAFGGAYINRVTDNLLRHTNAYVELRWRPLDAVSCQLGHYSSIGDDTGENLMLCGLHWDFAR